MICECLGFVGHFVRAYCVPAQSVGMGLNPTWTEKVERRRSAFHWSGNLVSALRSATMGNVNTFSFFVLC